MECDNFRREELICFSDRVARLLMKDGNLNFPSQEDVGRDNIHIPYSPSLLSLNALPRVKEQTDIRRSFLRRQDDEPGNGSSPEPEILRSENLAQTVLMPATVICVPIALLATALLALVYAHQIHLEPNIFNPADNAAESPGFVLVNYSATRLVFLASILSTLAPLLGSFIMSLFALPVSRGLRNASREGKYLHLPTPFQMSLLIGILAASGQQLQSYLRYFVRRRRSTIPPVLHFAAAMMLLGVLLAAGVFVADTLLHYKTVTVELDQISTPPRPKQQLGRGLSEFCLTFNRTNVGYPCSVNYDSTDVDPNANLKVMETSRLLGNTSQISEIQTTMLDQVPGAPLAYLLPRPQTVAANTDYNATSIGVSSSCRFIPPSDCGMVFWGGSYTNFSCTDAFHGILGLPPKLSANVYDPRPPDPFGRSLLMYKPAGNLMYSFFNDSGMEVIYNTVGLDDSGNLNYSIWPYPDSQLANPFHLGFAGRFYTDRGQFPAGHEMLKNNTNQTFVSPPFLDFILECAVTSYDISYTWVDDSLQSMRAVRGENGSVLEVFHGAQLYDTISGGDTDLQNFLTQASLAGSTTESFLVKFGSLYSTKVLSVIGGYTTGRLSLAEQRRLHMLLSQVPVVPLALLVSWSLVYALVGLILAVLAYRASRGNVRDIAAQLSLLGLSQAAFADRRPKSSSGGSSMKEEPERTKTQRVLVHGDAQLGFEFGVMV